MVPALQRRGSAPAAAVRIAAEVPLRLRLGNADGEDPASVFAYHRYYGLSFPALLDPSSTQGNFHKPGAGGPVTTRYGIGAYPTFYVIDPNGRITWRSDNEQPDALLRRELRQAARG